MPRDLILGTAGHIDHGKTSLVKALTGIDCDRLPEEKARGITIDIGFAHLDLGDYRLGIVDVPGHEKFIKNMLAGATGIDLAVLVIAADDGVMPQTREHLAILQLLGIRHGVIALTKVDLVDATTCDVVELEIRELCRGTFLENAPVVRTSAQTGEGLDALKAALREACGQALADKEGAHPAGRSAGDWFRLAIDRVFVVQGHGTVVTGSVTSGSLKAGDEVEWLPRGERVRVRSLQSHDQPVPEVHRGMRAAINLASVKHEEIVRGHELATPGYLVPSKVLTVRLYCLQDARGALRHRVPVRLHCGAAEIMGEVSLLTGNRLDPGQWGLAQLFLEEPALAVWGQPFIIRNASAVETLGGGQVLQPVARKLRRRHVEILDHIGRLWSGSAEERVCDVAWLAGPTGITSADLVRNAGIHPAETAGMIERLAASGRIVAAPAASGRGRYLHAELVQELEERVGHVLQRLHDQYPLVLTHDRRQVEDELNYVGDMTLVHAAVEGLIKRGVVVGDARRIALANHRPRLTAGQQKLKERLLSAYREARFQPPDPGSFAPQAGGNVSAIRDLLEAAVAEGLLVQFGPDLYLHAAAAEEMRTRISERLRSQAKGLTVAEIRDLLQTTRKFAVPLCEHLDRIGLTRREGDLRYLASNSS